MERRDTLGVLCGGVQPSMWCSVCVRRGGRGVHRNMWYVFLYVYEWVHGPVGACAGTGKTTIKYGLPSYGLIHNAKTNLLEVLDGVREGAARWTRVRK